MIERPCSIAGTHFFPKCSAGEYYFSRAFDDRTGQVLEQLHPLVATNYTRTDGISFYILCVGSPIHLVRCMCLSYLHCIIIILSFRLSPLGDLVIVITADIPPIKQKPISFFATSSIFWEKQVQKTEWNRSCQHENQSRTSGMRPIDYEYDLIFGKIDFYNPRFCNY